MWNPDAQKCFSLFRDVVFDEEGSPLSIDDYLFCEAPKLKMETITDNAFISAEKIEDQTLQLKNGHAYIGTRK